jgi:putative phosphoesterase
MTTLAVLSDLHGNLSALEAAEADLARRKVDQVLILGDLVGYLSRPNRVVQRLALRMAQKNWRVIAGNYDLAVVAGGDEGAERFLKPGIGEMPRRVFDWTCEKVNPQIRELLSTLPQSLSFEISGVTGLAVHGSPDGIRDYVYPDRPQEHLAAWLENSGVQCIFMGHTHQPFVRKLSQGLVVNPGSLGQPKDGDPRPSYALVNLVSLKAKIVRLDYDLEKEAELLQEAGMPERSIEKLKNGK